MEDNDEGVLRVINESLRRQGYFDSVVDYVQSPEIVTGDGLTAYYWCHVRAQQREITERARLESKDMPLDCNNVLEVSNAGPGAVCLMYF